ncbi:MAG TPA: quinoprotein dehydrogenase-associated putative ABC transporter substrate-binding protein [Acidobacteriaceae bacterium]|nr:quinoprotein dehydrogenase-associated putative ABC transporter substrate-binding protein [Acidobacteriaceae bacterium]
MSSPFPNLLALWLFLLCGATVSAAPLRICADPNNLPFSNRSGSGFDNRIALLIAHDLHRQPLFVWTRPRRGFLREQFNRDVCDLLPGVPERMHGLGVSAPYYASSYVFVTPSSDHLKIASFSDPQLNGRRIGLQVLDEDLSPPSLPLIRAGHASQLVGFQSFNSQEGKVVDAVANGTVSVAVVWGPAAGYYANRSTTALTLTPIPPSYTFSGIPFTYGIGFGVHHRDTSLLEEVNRSIAHLRPEIDQILMNYHVRIVSTNAEGR